MENNFYTKPNIGFWQKLDRPFFALAPMADVTDVAFRAIVRKYSRHGELGGGPDVFWTEFVSVNGLLSEAKEILLRDLEYRHNERPVVAQIFGDDPIKAGQISAYCQEIGFDGVDINAGCPDKAICNQGAGCGMIKNIDNTKQVIEACKLAAPNIPISIKTRLGWSTDETDTWIRGILEAKPAVLTVHVRTRSNQSKTCPEWGRLKIIVELKNAISPETLILANGGIRTKTAGRAIAEFTGCDGIMMGKAIFGNPWLFDDNVDLGDITIRERIQVLLEHTELFLYEMGNLGPAAPKTTLLFGDDHTHVMDQELRGKNFALMKKHFKAYIHGFPGAKELRTKMMECDTLEGITNITQEWSTAHPELANSSPKEEYVA